MREFYDSRTIDAVASRARLSGDDVLTALRRAGGEATLDDLRRDLDVHPATIRRHLWPLLHEQLVEEVRRGRYRLAGEPPVRSKEARELLVLLEQSGYEAHLTGFDLLAPHAHQFVFGFPHLVYGDPGACQALSFELPSHGFVVGFVGPGVTPTGPEQSRIVLLRTQVNAEQYGVRAHIAPVEKAWVDTLREARRGNLDVSYLELGRILRSVLDSGADRRYLRRYARQLGYLVQVDDALGATQEPTSTQGAALRAGFNG